MNSVSSVQQPANRALLEPDRLEPDRVAPDRVELELLGESSQLRRTLGGQPLLQIDYPLGFDMLVRQCFKQAPPRPQELEHAIDLTEEIVIAKTGKWAAQPDLLLLGAGACVIASSLAAAAMGKPVLTVDEVEAVFNRLVALSEGRPTSQESLPGDRRFVAAFLMLREVMHHLHFQQVTLPQCQAPA